MPLRRWAGAELSVPAGSAPTLPASQGAPRDNSRFKGLLVIFSFIPIKIRKNPPGPCPTQPLGDSWPVARASRPAPAGAELGCCSKNWPVHLTTGQMAASPNTDQPFPCPPSHLCSGGFRILEGSPQLPPAHPVFRGHGSSSHPALSPPHGSQDVMRQPKEGRARKR